jgi:choline-glycine betaine transporter
MNEQSPKIDVTVFAVAAGISVVFVLVGVLFQDELASVVGDVLSWVLDNLGWLFVLSTAAFLILVLFLALSRFGRIRLGRDEDRPEFRTTSWIAMMFSAGMGIGLMFYGVAEPISHLAAPPLGQARPNTPEAAESAMEWTYFHWALHPWALYAIVGMALGYFCFRRGMPNLISSVFYPLLGERVHGPIGKAIDILAIFATMFGSATSLGLGALQISSGLNFVWDVEATKGLAVVIILVLTALFVLSAVSGVERGVQWLSNFNMLVAAGRSGSAAGRSSTGSGGCRGRRSSARSSRVSPRDGRCANS